jgi:hypothetical protein
VIERVQLRVGISSRALQGRLRRDGAIVELTVDKNSVAGYSPDSNDVSVEAEESLLLEAVARGWLLETRQAAKRLSGCCCDL